MPIRRLEMLVTHAFSNVLEAVLRYVCITIVAHDGLVSVGTERGSGAATLSEKYIHSAVP